MCGDVRGAGMTTRTSRATPSTHVHTSSHTFHNFNPTRCNAQLGVLAQCAWMDAVDEVLRHETTAFALSRPPGHHAVRSQSMGFCVFNFAVGAAKYAIDKYGLSRVGILDFDVHYGNGIADLVERDARIRWPIRVC